MYYNYLKLERGIGMEQCSACKCNKACNQEYKKSCTDKSKVQSDMKMTCPETTEDSIGCMPIAMAYVPWQQWGDVYKAECGLAKGTIFPNLVKPLWVCCGQKK